MSFRMLHDFVLLELDQGEEQTDSGILIPDSIDTLLKRATVLSFGPGHYDDEGRFRPTDGIKVGDTVVISRLAGAEAEESGKLRLIVRYEELLAVDD